jgi:biopolymer transport protein ExbB/TolQ
MAVYLNSLIEFIEAHRCNQLVLQSDQKTVAQRAGGESFPLPELLSAVQIRTILAEVLPASHIALLDSGQSFVYQHASDRGAFDVRVTQNGPTIAVTLSRHLPLTAPASIGGEWSSVPPKIAPTLPAEPQFTRPTTPHVEPAGAGSRAGILAHAAFPHATPSILKWQETTTRVLGAVFGIAVGLLVSIVLYAVSDRRSMVGHMFDLRDYQAIVPVSVCCMFFWGVFICHFRWMRIRALERVCPTGLVVGAIETLSTGGVKRLSADLEGKEQATHSPLLRRLLAVVQQWLLHPGLQDADLILQQHVAHDAESVHRGYNLVRTFVWALPVLGLIGTVVGIALAVGGFAKFLGGNIDDVGVIKQSLVGVTGGLSFAFLITLEGLLTSLLLMLAASSLQSREERLLATVQQEIADHFLPAVQRLDPEKKAGADDRNAMQQALQHIAEGVMRRVAAFSTQLGDEMEQRQAAHSQQLTNWSASLRTEAEVAATRLTQAVSHFGGDLETASGNFLSRLSLIQDTLQKHTEELQKLAGTITSSTSQTQQDITKAAGEQIAAVRAASETVARLSETTASALARQEALESAMRGFADDKLLQSLNSVSTSLREQTAQTISAAEAAKALSDTTRDVLAGQSSLQQAMTQWHELGLQQTLGDMAKSLVHVGRVLESFRKPIVFQAVEVDSAPPLARDVKEARL